MSAILLGSISTIADTSELQREAFNEAFAEHGLEWNWDRQTYLGMLEQSGGQDRVAEYARSRGENVDAEAVHHTKSEVFRRKLVTTVPATRPGVVETVAAARREGLRVALVTSTSTENVTKLLSVLPDLGPDDFDLVVDSSSVATPKPDAAAYTFALERLGESASDCVAVEDNVGGAQAADAAGIVCVAFPNANTAGHSFDSACRRVDRLDVAELRELIA